MVYQTSINAARQKTQAIVKQAAARAGIEIEIKSVVASVFFGSDLANPDNYPKFYSDIQMYNNGPGAPDPQNFMLRFVSWEISSKENKWQGRNTTRWRNEESDRLWRAASTEMDPVKRAALFIRMNDLVVQNVVVIPIIWRKPRRRLEPLRQPNLGWARPWQPRLLAPRGVMTRRLPRPSAGMHTTGALVIFSAEP